MYICLYISFITLQSIYLAVHVSYSQTWSSNLLSAYLFTLFFHFTALSFILSASLHTLFHALPSRESQHFLAHPRSIPFSASACTHRHTCTNPRANARERRFRGFAIERDRSSATKKWLRGEWVNLKFLELFGNIGRRIRIILRRYLPGDWRSFFKKC